MSQRVLFILSLFILSNIAQADDAFYMGMRTGWTQYNGALRGSFLEPDAGVHLEDYTGNKDYIFTRHKMIGEIFVGWEHIFTSLASFLELGYSANNQKFSRSKHDVYTDGKYIDNLNKLKTRVIDNINSFRVDKKNSVFLTLGIKTVFLKNWAVSFFTKMTVHRLEFTYNAQSGTDDKDVVQKQTLLGFSPGIRLSHDITQDTSLTLEYAYTIRPKKSFGNMVDYDPNNSRRKADFRLTSHNSHTILLGLVYKL